LIFGAVRDPVREFIRAFNERDLDGFVETLHPEVELHSGRGLRKGVEAARLWATREPGGVQQTIVLDELYEERDRAVALITRSWRWAHDDSPAGEEEMAWRFELEDGRVRGWRPYEERQEALRAGGFEHGIAGE
jgi:limonene-1,2-epoxide hydrolase